ncbi:hypothetical protein CCR75_003739 [Bremia lactucae]|uniref:Mitochondrial ribonuclease P catalytic subunit n=1 Tax=Bremia lactucae TaxID=4779 RepID=A0A976IE12_BRELC|nr:hypothetical protein CCR75_003739 [Bremia lactucae]
MAHPACKLTKKQRRRERKQTPADKIEFQYRTQVQECARRNDAKQALEVYEHMKRKGVKVAPYICNVVINVCSKADDPAVYQSRALEVYQDMRGTSPSIKQKKKKADSDEPMYSAIIKLCSKARDFDACKMIVAEMEAAKVEPKLRTFGPLLQAYSDAGNLNKSMWVYEKLVSYKLELSEDDYVALLRVCSLAGHAKHFYAILECFIDDIWQPSLSTWDVLTDWFNSEAARVNGHKWRVTHGTVSTQGVCSVTGDQLQSIELSVEVTMELLAKIEKLVRTDEKRIGQWDDFKQWLKEFGPFDVVIDAANVGYCNQNFDGGGFDYAQINLMVQHYELQKKKVLIVLHERRTSDEQVPAKHRKQVAQWRKSHTMFNCQHGNNDDWYWLYAAVKLGGRTLLVSNDEMRDHHFQMIHNRAFHRWKERHQVHYQVHGWRVTVEEPLPYSARPQRVGNNWHFPSADVSDKDSTDTPRVVDCKWLCVKQD